MSLTKEKFYENKGKGYLVNDIEASYRYKTIYNWFNLKKTSHIYEIGCKYGLLREMIIRENPHAHYKGVDIDNETLKKIKDIDQNNFINHNVNDGLPFDESTADYLVCCEILEHLDNATFFLKEAKRVLKPDGRLIISIPNPYCWSEIFSNYILKDDDQGHIASYTYQNINALLKFSDLKIYDSKGSFCRVPFSKRIIGRSIIFPTNLFFLTRNKLYLIGKRI